MAASGDDVLAIRSTEDIIKARQRVRDCAVSQGFSIVDQTKLVTAASELARNTLVHGGGGDMHVQSVDDGIRRGVQVTFTDRGPGIADIELALKDGYSTSDGLGLGLGGARRLVNEFTLDSKPGVGTRVSIVRWK